jgi:hypothetical protein
MYFRYGIIVFFSVMFCLSVYGQSGDDRIYTFQDHHAVFGKNNVSLSMAPLIANGFEVNYDRRIVERHWIKLAPIYYRKEDYKITFPGDMRYVQGYGFKIQHKYFPYANTEKKTGLFLSYGPTYQHFDIETKGYQSLSLDKIGFECVVGVRKVFYNVFYYEFYAGMATNCLNIKNDETGDWRVALKDYNSLWFDYGKTGSFITLSVTLGVLF